MKHIFFLCTLITGSVLLTGFDKIDFFFRYPDGPANYDKELDNETGELPKDADGWTVITPSADSKIIYVSSSTGNDSNNGLSPENAVANIEKASSLVRNGYPDHILLKCGDVWENPYVYRFHSGRSATEPMVISYYGDSISRPLLLINSLFLNIDGYPISNVAFVGLEFYAWKHDPNSPDFNNNTGISVFRFVGAGGANVLIEDCVARYASIGAFDACCPDGTRFSNVALRRNIITHAWTDSSYYPETGADARISGFYASETDGILIEDCLFDHNGYDEDVEGGGANMFNHNIYLQYDCSAATIIRNNILARGSAHGVQLRGGGTCSDNIFIQNSVNLNIGGSGEPHDGVNSYSYANDNVFYESKLMDSTNIAYPRTGANVAIVPILPSTIENNVLTHSLNEGASGISEYVDEYGLGGSVTLSNNIEYKWNDWSQIPDPLWFDPDRKLSHYHQNLKKEPSTVAFLEEAVKRPLHTLWPKYSAETLIEFFKTGFRTDMVDVNPPDAPDTIYFNNISDVSAELIWSYGVDDQRTIAYNIYLDHEKYNSEPVNKIEYKVSGLSPETEYTVWIKSIDVGGNESVDSVKIRFITLAKDLEAPTVPVNLSLKARGSITISLTWNHSTDNYGVNVYKVYLDGEAIPGLLPTDSSVTVTGLAHSTQYTFKITAIDNSGNESGFSNEIIARTIDIVKPESPQNVHITTTTDSTIGLEWDPAIDNVGVVIYYILINGSLVDSTSNANITLTGLEAGTRYSMNVGALDAEGNKSRNSPPLVIQSLYLDEYKNASEIVIYPIPASQELFISGEMPMLSVEIFDLTGRKLLEKEAENKTRIQINISKIPEGIWLIRVNQENKSQVMKIIIEH
jgi:chitodextrinase